MTSPENLQILSECVNTSSPSVTRLMALTHPNLPLEGLINCSDSIAWEERHAVANHPNTPKSVLKKLKQDVNSLVIEAATQNWQNRFTENEEEEGNKLTHKIENFDENNSLDIDNNDIDQNQSENQEQLNNNEFDQELSKLLAIQKENKYKPTWVYSNLKNDFTLTYPNLKKIAKALDYKEGWAYYKYIEICRDKITNSSNHEEKLEFINNFINAHPEFADLYIIRADLYQENNQYNESYEDYTNAIKLKNDKTEYYQKRANLCLLINKQEQGIEDCYQILDLYDKEDNKSKKKQEAIDKCLSLLDKFNQYPHITRDNIIDNAQLEIGDWVTEINYAQIIAKNKESMTLKSLLGNEKKIIFNETESNYLF